MRKLYIFTLLVAFILMAFSGCNRDMPIETAGTEQSVLTTPSIPVTESTTQETEEQEETMMTKEPEVWWTEPPDDPNAVVSGDSEAVQGGGNTLLIPWQVNAVNEAVRDGKVHYYFMSSEGQPMVATATYPEKWGDACLMALPDGKLILIDSGHKLYTSTLVQNLRRLGVQKLDCVLISHYHTDHIGGIVASGGILDNFDVGQVLVPNVQTTASLEVESLCVIKGVPLKKLSQGDKLMLGQLSLQVLWPDSATSSSKITTTEAGNNASLVVRFDYGGHSSLFTGDIYSSVEKALANQLPHLMNVDLLKSPHHGDTTSNSDSLASAATANIVVATGYLGIKNRVYSTYENAGGKVLCDKNNGYIHITADGANVTWESSRLP